MGTLSKGLSQSYYDYARRGKVYSAFGAVVIPAIYTTATAQIFVFYNNTLNSSTQSAAAQVNAILLGLSFGVVTAATAACTLGIATGASTAPSTTTAITTSGSTFPGQPAPLCNVYKKGTVSAAATNFLPLIQISTEALTAQPNSPGYIDLQGQIVIPPGYFASVASTVAADGSLTANIGLIWAEEQLP